MATERKNVERFMEVGAVAMLHTEPHRKDGPRFRTVFRGWRKSVHVLLDRPKTELGSFVSLHEGQPCVMRFLHEGRACAFDTQVIDWDTRRVNPYLRIRWPQSLEYIGFRKFERIKLASPCVLVLNDGQRLNAELVDLSLGGCGITCNSPVTAGMCLTFSFTMPDGMVVENVDIIVRNVRESAEQFLLGAQFLPGQDIIENDVAFYVTNSLERARAEQGDLLTPRILIIDDNQDQMAKLKENFEAQGYSVLLANNTVEGIFRMRMSNPLAAVISAEMSDLPGIDLCRLLKANRQFEHLPVFVYGGQGEALNQRVQEVGGERYFPKSPAMIPEIAFEVARQVTQVQARV
jgi:CheY-like chemotaxis protein